MLKPGMKRFYKTAAIENADNDSHRILLDGRSVRSPMSNSLELPTKALAQAVADEWLDQKDDILPATMPMTQLAFTALDRVATERTAIIDSIAKFGESDLLCYRADHPADLVMRQNQSWDPLIDWADETYDAKLTVTSGIVPVVQPVPAMHALRDAIDELEDFRLTALAAAVQASGSLIIGLALIEGHVDGDQAVAASQLDEAYQGEMWGEDKEAVDRLRGLQQEIADAERFLSLL